MRAAPSRPSLTGAFALLLVLIIAGAAYLRLAGLASSTVTPEQLTLLRLAARSLNTGRLPLAGHEWAGLTNPPLAVYLLALPLRWQATLLAAFSFQALLGVSAIPLLYFSASQCFGRSAGLLAAFLLAIYPWTAPTGPILLFAVLLLSSLLFYTTGRRPGLSLALLGFALAGLTQLEWSAWLLLPVVGLLLWINWRPGNWRPLLLALLFFLLFYLPYLSYERPRAFSDLLAGWRGLFAAGQHFFFLLPPLCLLPAVLLDKALNYWRGRPIPFVPRLLLVGLAALVLAALAWWPIQQFRATALPITAGSIGAIDSLISLSREQLAAAPGCGLLVLGQANHADSSPLGFLEEFVYPHEVRFVEQGRGLLLPGQCALYLLAGSDPTAEAWLQTNGRLLTDSPPFYQIQPPPLSDTAPLAIWRNGLKLLDYQIEGTAAPGQQLVIHYTWHVIQRPRPGVSFHFFTHFLDGNGQIITQEDGPGIHTAYWRPGDVLLTRFYLNLPADLPAGAYTIQTGVYTWPELRRVRLHRSEETTYPVVTLAVSPP